ncbi:hypothetical protein [Demequina lignilytica]|uniref:Uncharacterized protein n=1 Tax=Demequina lignilytica TaxID=3051663 RepID=A0AAW7M6Z4_9MICO|nr:MULTISPECIES: hypothetical protein [unclassified Demequina]MDN4478194.1 hypothetical protein [Demequina sp. SYSU T00039-1]MDN4482727.1 hypothetical protein [Demequina sp. SYSU T0a273]MDN4488356.1 hypothetical protein [Demequina sp. SYSU T00039]MDN4490097.1 hypothetical protein [Demequina sp. SYSU T00068]
MPDRSPAAPPEVGKGARRAVRWSLGLLAVTMLVLLLGPTWALATLLLAPATAAAMVVALVMLRSTRLVGLKVMLAIGIGVSAIALLYGVVLLVFHGPVDAYTECQARAITHQAQRQCEQDYEDAIVSLMERFGLTTP